MHRPQSRRHIMPWILDSILDVIEQSTWRWRWLQQDWWSPIIQAGPHPLINLCRATNLHTYPFTGLWPSCSVLRKSWAPRFQSNAFGISQLCGLGRDSDCIPYYLWRGPSHSPDIGSVYCIHYTVPDMREMQTSLKQKADTHTHTHTLKSSLCQCTVSI